MSTVDTPETTPEPGRQTWSRWNGDLIVVKTANAFVAAATMSPERLGAPICSYQASGNASPAPARSSWTARDAGIILGFAGASYLLASQMYDVASRTGLPSVVTYFVVDLLAYGLDLLPLLLLARLRGGLANALRLRSVPREWIINVPVIAFIVLASTSVWAALLGHFIPADPRQCSAIHDAANVSLIFGMILPVLIAPLIEEAIFRGVLFSWLRSRVGRGWAVAGSTLVFAAFHVKAYGLMTALQVAPLGATLAVVYDVSGSLVPGMAIHVLYNLVGYVSAAHGC